MPNMDGHAFVRAVRAKERTAGTGRTYVVALSGFTSLQDRDEARLELVISVAGEIPDDVPVHLKLDTGMGR